MVVLAPSSAPMEVTLMETATSGSCIRASRIAMSEAKTQWQPQWEFENVMAAVKSLCESESVRVRV
eukprot:1448952-Rhodomonas_salina.2